MVLGILVIDRVDPSSRRRHVPGVL